MNTTKKMLITCFLVATASMWLAAQSCSTGFCPATITVHHKAGTLSPQTVDITYGVAASSLSGTASCWITRNLGATTAPTAFGDATTTAAGWFYQFDRKQGYYSANGTTLTAPYTAPVLATYYTANTNSLPANDPCTQNLGPAWRLPTQTEIAGLTSNFTATGPTLYASVIKVGPVYLWWYPNKTWGPADGGYLTSTSVSVSSFGTAEIQNAGSPSWSSAAKENLYPVRCLKLLAN